jgi:hypothetical protein
MEGARSLATVKVLAQRSEAEIRVKANALEISHALAVEDIISTAEKNIHDNQESTITKIASIQADITKTKKEQANEIATVLS